jgi:hypothetical protein
MSLFTRVLVSIVFGLFAALVPAISRAEGAGPFGFVVPEGFSDVKRSPPPPWGKLPPASAALITNPDFIEYAVDFTDPDAKFLPNFNAQVKEGSLKVTDAALAEVANELVNEMPKAVAGAQVTVVEQGLYRMPDATAGRIVYDLTVGGLETRGLQYLMPSKKHVAILTYTAPKERFAELLPYFEASARATTGVHDAPWYLTMNRILATTLIGGALGGLLGVLVWLSKKLRGE